MKREAIEQQEKAGTEDSPLEEPEPGADRHVFTK